MFWEEWLSVKYPDFKQFADTLRWHLERPYGIMLVALGKDPAIDLHMDEWRFLKPHLKFIVDLAEKGKKRSRVQGRLQGGAGAKDL